MRDNCFNLISQSVSHSSKKMRNLSFSTKLRMWIDHHKEFQSWCFEQQAFVRTNQFDVARGLKTSDLAWPIYDSLDQIILYYPSQMQHHSFFRNLLSSFQKEALNSLSISHSVCLCQSIDKLVSPNVAQSGYIHWTEILILRLNTSPFNSQGFIIW